MEEGEGEGEGVEKPEMSLLAPQGSKIIDPDPMASLVCLIVNNAAASALPSAGKAHAEASALCQLGPINPPSVPLVAVHLWNGIIQ